MSVQEIKSMTRDELVAYLEGWGFQCYDHESISCLRTAALENFKTEKA
jgi:hypothetical protein